AYFRDVPAGHCATTPSRDGGRFEDGHLSVVNPITIESKVLGTLAVESDLKEMYSRFGSYAAIKLFMLLVAMGIAALLSERFQRVVSQPIVDLVGTAQRVSDAHDYSIRVSGHRADEIGQLMEAFNHMLAVIQEHDLTLQRANRDLSASAERLEQNN